MFGPQPERIPITDPNMDRPDRAQISNDEFSRLLWLECGRYKKLKCPELVGLFSGAGRCPTIEVGLPKLRLGNRLAASPSVERLFRSQRDQGPDVRFLQLVRFRKISV
jgi:hypothetical protein